MNGEEDLNHKAGIVRTRRDYLCHIIFIKLGEDNSYEDEYKKSFCMDAYVCCADKWSKCSK